MNEIILQRPLVFFDFETTGTDPKDRIVEYCFYKKVTGYKTEKVLTGYLNPEIPIPKSATEVHGISDFTVKDAPTFRSMAETFELFLRGCDWAGHNIVNYDVPLLMNEFKRINYRPKLGKPYLIDTLALDRKLRNHELSTVYHDYTGESLDGAHGAEVDTLAVIKVLPLMLQRYKKEVPRIINQLHTFLWNLEKYVDMSNKFYWDLAGEAVFNFGNKHKNRLLREVVRYDKDYIEKWMLGPNTNFTGEVKCIARNALRGIFPKKKEGGGYILETSSESEEM